MAACCAANGHECNITEGEAAAALAPPGDIKAGKEEIMPEQSLNLAQLLRCYGLEHADRPDFLEWAENICRARARRKKDPTVYGEDRNGGEGSEEEGLWSHG